MRGGQGPGGARGITDTGCTSTTAGNHTMKATQMLHERGQSLWLDNMTRDLIDTGTLARYIDELSITGLTSNSTIFEHAITHSHAHDAAIGRRVQQGKGGEELFFELALEDVRRAADFFRPRCERTEGVDGWVSLEVSPLLAHDSRGTLAAARALHTRAARPRDDQDPGDARRPSSHRRVPVRRRSDQCHIVVLAGTVSCGGRKISARIEFANEHQVHRSNVCRESIP